MRLICLMKVHLGEDIAHGIQRSKCLSVLVDGQEVTCLGTGDYFGEVGLLHVVLFLSCA